MVVMVIFRGFLTTQEKGMLLEYGTLRIAPRLLPIEN